MSSKHGMRINGIPLTEKRLLDDTSKALKAVKLRARYDGDLDGAIISAGYHAKKNRGNMYVYLGNSYGNRIYQRTYKFSDANSRINNSGSFIITVTPELDVYQQDRTDILPIPPADDE